MGCVLNNKEKTNTESLFINWESSTLYTEQGKGPAQKIIGDHVTDVVVYCATQEIQIKVV